MLHPSQFQVDEAWIMFQVNELPIRTMQDGDFNCVVIMDAASCFLMGIETVPASEEEPSELGALRLLKAGWSYHHRYPATLFVPEGQFRAIVPAVAAKHGIDVVSASESDLAPLIEGARRAFAEYEGD